MSTHTHILYVYIHLCVRYMYILVSGLISSIDIASDIFSKI